MERIDMFDRYFNGELSEEEKLKFEESLETDEEFASEFEVYSMTVAGICKEAKQDNADFAAAMNHLTKEQLFEIIGRKPKPKTQEDVIEILNPAIACCKNMKADLSVAAAFNDIEDDEYEDDDENENKNTEGVRAATIPPEANANRGYMEVPRGRNRIIYIAIVIIVVVLIIIGLLLS